MLGASAQADELAKSKLEKVKRLQQQAHRDWQEIKHGSLKFQRCQQEAAAIRSLHKSDLVAFFKVNLMQRRLSCCQSGVTDLRGLDSYTLTNLSPFFAVIRSLHKSDLVAFFKVN